MRVKIFKKGSDPDWKIEKNKKNRTKVKPQWIPVQEYKDGIYNSIPSKTYYACSNCGWRSFYQKDNCPKCNMRLKKTGC